MKNGLAVAELDETRVHEVYSGSPGCGCGCRGRYFKDARNITRVVRRMKLDAKRDDARSGMEDGVAFVETPTRYLWAYYNA